MSSTSPQTGRYTNQTEVPASQIVNGLQADAKYPLNWWYFNGALPALSSWTTSTIALALASLTARTSVPMGIHEPQIEARPDRQLVETTAPDLDHACGTLSETGGLQPLRLSEIAEDR